MYTFKILFKLEELIPRVKIYLFYWKDNITDRYSLLNGHPSLVVINSTQNLLILMFDFQLLVEYAKTKEPNEVVDVTFTIISFWAVS